jgi:hypothetical protein
MSRNELVTLAVVFGVLWFVAIAAAAVWATRRQS